MRFEELLPGRPPLTLRGRLDPVLPEDVGDGPSPDAVIQIRERALNPRVAPVAVLGRHPHHQLPNLRHDRRPSRTAPLVAVVLPSDQVPMPGQQRGGGHDRNDVVDHPPRQFPCLGGQTNALIVREAQPPRSELLPEHTVLLLEVVDHIALLLMDPAGHRHKQTSQRMRQRRHHASVSEAQTRVSLAAET